jgi:hypothetical protein
MPVSVQLGLLLALCCAFVQILGFMFKQRGAASAPPVRWREPVRSSVALFANRWWTLGILVAMAGWASASPASRSRRSALCSRSSQAASRC